MRNFRKTSPLGAMRRMSVSWWKSWIRRFWQAVGLVFVLLGICCLLAEAGHRTARRPRRISAGGVV